MIDISDEFYFNFFLFLHFVGWMGFFRQVINLEFNALMFCKNKLNFCVFYTKHPSKYHIFLLMLVKLSTTTKKSSHKSNNWQKVAAAASSDQEKTKEEKERRSLAKDWSSRAESKKKESSLFFTYVSMKWNDENIKIRNK